MIRFIAEHKDYQVPGSDGGAGLRWGVEPMCAVLSANGVSISPSTYYEWINKTPTRRQVREAELVEIISTQRNDAKTGKFVQTLGSRKMWIRLRGQGHDVARCTVERIMRAQGWEGARYGSKHKTTISDYSHARYPDLVDRHFCAPTPNRLWVADFTYVATWSGFVYVAFVIDAFSRRILGWRAARSMTTPLVLDALEHAFFTRAQEGHYDLRGLIAHNDAGAQGSTRRWRSRSGSSTKEWTPRSGRSATHWTTRSPRRPSVRSRTSSSIGKARGATSARSNSPPPNGSTGSTPNVPTTTSTTSPPQPSKRFTTITGTPHRRRGDSRKSVPGLTGTAHIRVSPLGWWGFGPEADQAGLCSVCR